MKQPSRAFMRSPPPTHTPPHPHPHPHPHPNHELVCLPHAQARPNARTHLNGLRQHGGLVSVHQVPHHHVAAQYGVRTQRCRFASTATATAPLVGQLQPQPARSKRTLVVCWRKQWKFLCTAAHCDELTPALASVRTCKPSRAAAHLSKRLYERLALPALLHRALEVKVVGADLRRQHAATGDAVTDMRH